MKRQGRAAAGRAWSGMEFPHCSCGSGRKPCREDLGNGNCSADDFLRVPGHKSGHNLPIFPLVLDLKNCTEEEFHSSAPAGCSEIRTSRVSWSLSPVDG